uniref:AA_TRNA_LIGASE_II domain-containing protein n=1 Tax=Steinernema glaseri TaxID=37863 RepID=A0A1I7Z771_9BILA
MATKSHEFFKNNDYIYIDTPMISLNDCEGAGEAFTLKAPKDEDFFGRPDVYLPVSGQLHLESIVGAIPRVYTIGTAFRAEKCLSRQHMAEFKMLEAECGFMDSLDDLCNLVEDYVRHVVKGFTEEAIHSDVLKHAELYRTEDSKNIIEMCQSAVRFPRLTYDEAVTLLADHGVKMLEAECGFMDSLDDLCNLVEDYVRHVVKGFTEEAIHSDVLKHAELYRTEDSKNIIEMCQSAVRFPRLTYDEAVMLLADHGVKVEADGFKKSHELKLVDICGSPVFVTHFPCDQKPFYMKRSGDKALCFDLLAPFVGELAGGSLREDDVTQLEERLPKEVAANLAWYLELRRCGQPNSGGFGLGVERLLQACLSIVNIKDTVAFPRWFKHCKC